MVSLYFENFLTNSSYNKYFLLSRGFFKKALYSSRWLKWNFKNNFFGYLLQEMENLPQR